MIIKIGDTLTDERGRTGVINQIGIATDKTDVAGEVGLKANEYDTELDVILSSRAPANEYDTELDVIVSSRAPASEYDTELTNLQSDVTDIKTKTDNLPTNTSDEIKRLLGIVDENSYCDLFTTVTCHNYSLYYWRQGAWNSWR